MNRAFSKIYIIGILAVVLAGGFFVWQKWQPSKVSENNFSMIYTFENYAWGEQIKRIEISKDGKISYYSKIGNKKDESFQLLTEEKLKEFSDLVISQEFFELSSDLTNPSCDDAPTEYMEITINSKTHRTGGGCVESETFRIIVEKLEEIVENKINKEETADWKIYKNNEHGFEIKYPSDWFNVTDEKINKELGVKWYEFSNKNTSSINLSSEEDTVLFQIEIAMPDGLDLFEMLKKMKPQEQKEKDLIIYTKLEDLTIGGVQAVKYSADFSRLPVLMLPRGNEVLLKKGENIFHFFPFGRQAESISEKEGIFNQIIFTFRFLE